MFDCLDVNVFFFKSLSKCCSRENEKQLSQKGWYVPSSVNELSVVCTETALASISTVRRIVLFVAKTIRRKI